MATTCEDVLNAVGEVYSVVTDRRYFTTEEVQTLYMFEKYLVNLLEARGVEYRGQSVKYGIPMCLLVLKGRVEGQNVVAFINGLSILGCKKIVVQQLLRGVVAWRDDRF